MAKLDILPADRPVDGLMRPFQRFFRLEAASGLLLLATAAIALIWANSPWADAYFSLWQTRVVAGAGPLMVDKPLLLWVNDGLMAIFFFLVGLEIKREVLVGELRSPRKAMLAIMAAIGGMVVPAGLYVLVTGGTPFVNGWGIPMATDIAFALGVLALLGSRAPVSLKIFLTALAIIDDLGAVMVIALFYTAEIKMTALGVAAVALVILMVGNRLRVHRTAFYVVFGLVLWLAFLKSGVHATIAGVLLALTIPASRRIDTTDFASKADRFMGILRGDNTTDRADAVHALEVLSRGAETPLARFEHSLHPWVAYFIMPVFALANAGVALGGMNWGEALGHPVTVGLVLGLFVGKQLGVTLFSWLAVRLGWASLPEGVTWRQVYGVSLLTGIGFTMSLFIANLSFAEPAILDLAKIGILGASLVAGVGGYLVLKSSLSKEPALE
ncbi:MAG: Na+/H+ antiporter NhaA [Rhodothermales bacterium]|nr:Na+/H+ antiporter NhaA [Rhodothermales bacterium]MBO6779248.1 Na+/H+ antiporter NhaA [Rhodothermales bacterium]